MEKVADNLSKAGWSWGCLTAVGSRRANDLDCWCTSRRRKAFRCTCGWIIDGVCGTWIGE